MLRIEDRAHHIVLIFNCDGEKVVSKALNEIYSIGSRGVKRFVIHVISPKGNIYYLDILRDLIRNNTVYTLFVRYHGSKPEDLEKLVRELNDNATYIIGQDMAEYRSVLEKYGIKPFYTDEVIMK